MQGPVSEDRENEELARARARREGTDGTRSSTELLDLVRSAEESATVAAKSRDSVPDAAPLAARAQEEFVDVGDEALEAPPSLPPEPMVRPAPRERSSGIHSRARAVPSAPSTPTSSLPPAVGILAMLALAIGALALLAR
jgi:hypothetical protein